MSAVIAPANAGAAPKARRLLWVWPERGGKIAAQVIPDIKKATLRGVVLDNVEPGSIVSTDELMSYGLLTGDGYKHGMVKHGENEWSYYDSCLSG
jgi:hypothetical protein